MPEISLLGWFHTVIGIIALLTGGYSLIKRKEIGLKHRAGQIYLLATLVTALSALGIFQHGGFGAGHALAVMTLVALTVGTVAVTTQIFGSLSRNVQAAAFSATLLFHSVPAITDGLMRLPVGDPIVTSLEDPMLKTAYMVLIAIYLVGLAFQLVWIRKQPPQQG
jgi:uncharacterized membrane protein